MDAVKAEQAGPTRERGLMPGPLTGSPGPRSRHPDRGARSAPGLLGEQGAEVIKIEQPGTGDFMREIGPFATDGRAVLAVLGGRGPRPQERHARPAHSPRARTLFRRLAATADVVVENFRPGTLERWNIAPGDLDPPPRHRPHQHLRPGRPVLAERPGLDRVGIGYGGLLHLTGYPDRPPVRVGVTISDYLTGVFAAQAATAALYARDAARRLRARSIDAALYGAALRILEWTHRRVRPPRHGPRPRRATGSRTPRRSTTTPPPTASTCASSPAPTPTSPACARRWSAPTSSPTRGSPRSPTAPRTATRSTASSPTGPRTLAAAEIEAACVAHDVPVATAYTAADMFADSALRGRGDLVTVDDPVVGPVRQQAPYPRFVGEPRRRCRRARPGSASTPTRCSADLGLDRRRRSTSCAARGVIV